MRFAEIEARYFEWMLELVCGERYASDISYRELLWHLHNIEFIYYIPNDYNRAADGVALRQQFAYYMELPDADRYIVGPCTVLEMMIALAIRCEKIMDNPEFGDRTAQWFWKMIANLGLNGMSDERFDAATVEEVIDIFMDHDYKPDGRGGLFTVRNCNKDMRDLEIWVQMCYFLDSIV